MRRPNEADLVWYLHQGPSELGCRSSLGGQIAALEAGGGASVPCSEFQGNLLAVRRERRCNAAWGALEPGDREVLRIHHGATGRRPPDLTAGVAGALGASPWLALELAHRRGHLVRLVTACAHPGRDGSAELITQYNQDARSLLARSLEAWDDAWTQTNPERKTRHGSH